MKTIYAKDRQEWRRWLEQNYAVEKEVGLIYYKKASEKQSITYMESVEEAICFGWIDGIKKRVDVDSYSHRFTPRRKNSKWSQLNISIAQRMIEQKRMTKSGLEAYQQRKEYERDQEPIATQTLNAELEQILKRNPKAWENFQNLAQGYRKQYILWLNSAKKETTQQKRMQEAIALLEQNKKLGMK